MLRRFKNKAFSLTEVLLAAGILAVGFMLVATTFPVGIKLTTVATERAVAAVATDEAVAKLKIYGVDPNKLAYDNLLPFGAGGLVSSRYTVLASVLTPQEIEELLVDESLYPSIETADINTEPQKYSWSALLKLKSGTVDAAQAVVFVSRKAGAGVRYPNPLDPLNANPFDPVTEPTGTLDWPEPIDIQREDDLTDPTAVKEIIINTADELLAKFVTDGSVIAFLVDIDPDPVNVRWEIELRQVLRREPFDAADTYLRKLVLSESVDESQLGLSFWVIPVGLGSSRNPCVTVEVWDL